MNYSNKLFILSGIIFLTSFYSSANSQDTVKIMTYNLLNYGANSLKDQSFRRVVNYSDPDILVVEEILSQADVNNFTNNVLNYYTPGLYSSGTFYNGFDSDNAVFYKTTEFTFLFNVEIPTALRTINMFGLVHNSTFDTIRLFAVHLKAGNTAPDQEQRLTEVNILRNFTNTLPLNSEFVVLGDFNIYSSTESCYQRLLQPDIGVEGHFLDPYNLPGTWNQQAYAPYHTQSTRTRSLGDGGATGGLDDRFDMILNSKAVTEAGRIKYISGSLKPFGNDGNHFNDSINQRPNLAVPDSIADALYYGSDHLPVTALYLFEQNQVLVNNYSSEIPDEFILYQNYPNPFNPVTKIKYKVKQKSWVSIDVTDMTGRVYSNLVNKQINPGSYETVFNGEFLSSGVYFYRMKVNGKILNSKKMILTR
ncbi:MAG: hypothetical protein HGGPFJEG_00796 [Ignavibacteria bacterium]|nr:hypothetical protein [Ignavibacteria bacterium]